MSQLVKSVRLLGLLMMAGLMFSLVAKAQPPARVAANYKLANKYSDAFLKSFTYSTSVEPQWMGKSDAFWYEYRTSAGKQWYKVTPSQAKKEPLFDRVKLAARLPEAAS